jgi:hypothetical protein
MAEAHISPIQLFLNSLDPNDPQYPSRSGHLYGPQSQSIAKLLDKVISDARGKAKVKSWLMESRVGRELIAELIHTEMDTVCHSINLHSKNDIDVDYLRDWEMKSYWNEAPFIYMCLLEAAESKEQRTRNKYKKPETVRICFSLFSLKILSC